MSRMVRARASRLNQLSCQMRGGIHFCRISLISVADALSGRGTMSTDDNKLVRIETSFEQSGLVIKPAEGETILYSPEDTQVIYNHLDQQQAWLARSSFVLIPVPG